MSFFQQHLETVKKCRPLRISEADTKRLLIEPILQEAGWDTKGIEEVRMEWKGATSDNPVDYALFLNNKLVAVVEAKGLDQSINDRKIIIQATQYAANNGIAWAIITNGDDWAIYHALAQADAEKKIFKRVNANNTQELEDFVKIIHKESFFKARIEELWQMEFTGKQVLESLQDMCLQGNTKLVKLLLTERSQLKRNDVIECLRQIVVALPNTQPIARANIIIPQKCNVTPTPKPREGTAISQLEAFFNHKWETDPTWFDRNYQHEFNQGRTRRTFAKSPQELYQDSKLHKYARQINNSSWVFDTNLSSNSITNRIANLSTLP